MRYSIKKSLLCSKIIILIHILTLLLIPSKQLYSELLDNWTDERAYKPAPILFLHGFGPGSPQRWDYIAGNLSQYYSPYQQIGPFIGNGGSKYLERIHFIDENGSVDGPGGWTDQLDHTINNLLDSDKYGDYSNKIILMAHSMGGLAARNYIMNGGESNVLKLITINTPHAGSPLANCSRNLVKSRTIALFIPVIGWGYAGSVTTVRAQVVDLNSIDLSGEAIRDLSIGSPFLTELANRGSPSSGNLIYGISSYTENILNQWFFWPYYPNSRTPLIPKYAGDSIVPIDSQEGWDVYTDEGKRNPVEVWHMDEAKRIYGPEHSSILQNSEVKQQILKWIDSVSPEIEIVGVKILENGVEQDAPLTGGVYQLNRSSCILQGSVKKEFFPANSILNITIQREGEGPQTIINAAVLKPDDSWDPNNSESVISGFKETINFLIPGRYEVIIKVINPASRESNQEIITIEANFTKPIIEPISPTPGRTIADRRPTIQARIYSLNGDEMESVPIDLGSIEMQLDGVTVSHSSNPPEGGSDIIITYTPYGDLDYRSHTVTVNASDITGAPAGEVSWSFVIAQLELIIEPIYPGQGQRIIDRTPNILARIYSNISGYIIEISSFGLRLDGIAVDVSLYPSDNGPEIFISFIPLAELDIGPHTVTVNISDVNGLATEETWTFYVIEADDITYFNIGAQFSEQGYSTTGRLIKRMYYHGYSAEIEYPLLRNTPPVTNLLHENGWGGYAGQFIGAQWGVNILNEIARMVYSFDTSVIPGGEIVIAKIILDTAPAGGCTGCFEGDGLKLYSGNWGNLEQGEWDSGSNIIAFLDNSCVDTIGYTTEIVEINPSEINRSGLTQIMFVTIREEQGIVPQLGSKEVILISDDISLEIGIIESE